MPEANGYGRHTMLMRGAPSATIKLTQPQNPTWSETFTADANGNWSFSGLRSGLYGVTVDPYFEFTNPSKDNIRRTYSRVNNARNPSEEEMASVDINGKRPDGATFTNDLDLEMPLDKKWSTRKRLHGPHSSVIHFDYVQQNEGSGRQRRL